MAEPRRYTITVQAGLPDARRVTIRRPINKASAVLQTPAGVAREMRLLMHSQSTPKDSPQRFTCDDDAFIAAHYRSMSCAQLAAALNRTVRAVRYRKSRLGLVDTSHCWTSDELSQLRALYSGDPGWAIDLKVFAAAIGRSRSNVCRKAKQLGLVRSQRRRRVVARKDAPRFASVEERNAAIGQKTKEYLRLHPHPRGAVGLRHTPETRALLARKAVDAWAIAKATGTGWMSDENRQRRSDAMARQQVYDQRLRQGYSHGSGGIRADIGIYVRSRWEANIARYLKWLQDRGDIHAWAYEAKTFWFEHIKRGTRSYTPDFEIIERPGSTPKYWEVKGWKHPRGQTALARMERYYPEVDITIIDADAYKAIAKWKALIPHWETGNGSHRD